MICQADHHTDPVPALVVMRWVDQDVFYCELCAAWMLKVAGVMGYKPTLRLAPTPEGAARGAKMLRDLARVEEADKAAQLVKPLGAVAVAARRVRHGAGEEACGFVGGPCPLCEALSGVER